ncbi:MAG: ATP-binding cassette domain-containing protein [Anaerolineaceae bacterium]|nr:ATP-binding cassette domain-containing protein [Anaerolineaceae bacterium]
MQIEIRHIHKRFGSIQANDDISIVFPAGRIVGILGENGAGKSTLMKILSGFQTPDEGEIWIDGQAENYRGPQAAIALGIGMLQQDPLDVPAMTVMDNFTYGAPGAFWLGHSHLREQIQSTSAKIGFDLSPDQMVNQLSIAQRQQLEIVRLLALGVRTLILDEPTTGISSDQKEQLFHTLMELAREEGMTILLVSHKLEDVITLCDEVIVLRAGKLVGQREMPTTKSELVHLMFGQQLTEERRNERDITQSNIVLQLDDFTVETQRLSVEPITLSLHEGEVVGLAGLDGSGQQPFMRACTGLMKGAGGRLRLDGEDMLGRGYGEFRRAGVAFGAAGRLEEGLIAGLTLIEHVALSQASDHWMGVLDWQKAGAEMQTRISRYDIRGVGEDMIEALSGGNQQRLLISLLPEQPRLLVIEQPTRGLDVDSVRAIWGQLLARSEQGAAILFSSSDLDELVTYSDRILVFFEGRTHLIEDPSQTTVSDLGHAIGGAFDSVQGEHVRA